MSPQPRVSLDSAPAAASATQSPNQPAVRPAGGDVSEAYAGPWPALPIEPQPVGADAQGEPLSAVLAPLLTPPNRRWGRVGVYMRWFDSWAQSDPRVDPAADPAANAPRKRTEWLRILPFASLHLACLAVFLVGWSPIAVAVAVGMYLVRMFAITGFYHRYFSHRAFKTSRGWQFVFALLGASATQRGPLWWASHHRRHHQHSDGPKDVHSPLQHGFWWSHIGWITSRENFRTDLDAVRDLVRYPELRFLDRFDTLVPVLTGAAMFALGSVLGALWPSLGTSGWQMLVWGYVISTVVLAHATFTINSLSHLIGWRRYATTDTSRNNPVLALLTLGEGWHNNHHYYQSSARQGFYWWELDLTYLGLKALAAVGIVHDLRPVPTKVRDKRL